MLFGLEEKINIFKRLTEQNSISHAYLFYGDAQIGKFLFAKSLANFFEKKIFDMPEMVLTDTKIVVKNEKGNIGIDESQNIKRFIFQTPFVSNKRTVIVNDAESMTKEAQAALLKIVEEPPIHGLIILIAQNIESIFPPLVSRLTRLYFGRISSEEIAKILIDKYKAKRIDAEKIAGLSFGRIGRAIDFLNNKNQENLNNELEFEIEKRILNLRGDGNISRLKKHSSVLAKLLEREKDIKKFNLNLNLQKKAIEFEAQ